MRTYRNCGRWVATLAALAVLLGATISGSAESEIDHLVQVLQLKSGSIVADVGAGSGEISVGIARRVGPQGKVYSTEINPQLLDKIRSLIQKQGVSNVIPIAGTAHDTMLPPNCCDAIFLRQVYHHLTDPLAMDQSLYKAMRPGARLAIIDFEPGQLAEPIPPGVPANRGGHGAPKKIVADELQRAGFVLLQTMDWPISRDMRHYCMLFMKPSARAETPPRWNTRTVGPPEQSQPDAAGPQ